jgi:hypothetical protein
MPYELFRSMEDAFLAIESGIPPFLRAAAPRDIKPFVHAMAAGAN